jgi:hypothetical protein
MIPGDRKTGSGINAHRTASATRKPAASALPLTLSALFVSGMALAAGRRRLRSTPRRGIDLQAFPQLQSAEQGG